MGVISGGRHWVWFASILPAMSLICACAVAGISKASNKEMPLMRGINLLMRVGLRRLVDICV